MKYKKNRCNQTKYSLDELVNDESFRIGEPSAKPTHSKMSGKKLLNILALFFISALKRVLFFLIKKYLHPIVAKYSRCKMRGKKCWLKIEEHRRQASNPNV